MGSAAVCPRGEALHKRRDGRVLKQGVFTFSSVSEVARVSEHARCVVEVPLLAALVAIQVKKHRELSLHSVLVSNSISSGAHLC